MTNISVFIQEITACIPHFEFAGIIAETCKSKVVFGRLNNKPVVVKILSLGVAHWRDKFANEIKIYRCFSNYGAPVKIVKVVYSNIRKGIIVYEQLMAQPLSHARYPADPAQFKYCQRIVSDIEKISGYRHLPRQANAGDNNFWIRKASNYTNSGILNSYDLNKIKHLLNISGRGVEFAHGDLLFTNCLIFDQDDSVAYLDWEFAGYYLKGYDLALLWIIMMKSPDSRKYILDHVFASQKDFPCEFFINLFLLIAREIKIHKEAKNVPGFPQILEGLAADLNWIRTVTRDV